MSYSVEHVRFTLECDACGLIEKRDLDSDADKAGTLGWSLVSTGYESVFCCPGCLKQVRAILTRREREAEAAQAALEAACKHDYQPRGMLAQCTKCKRWK
jgi:hypothetical protein